jgi:transcription elongation factor SPT5
LEEITKFAAGTDNTDGIDLSSLAAGIKAASKLSTFAPGDMVEVFEGEQAGVYGSVESVVNHIATIVSSYAGLKGQRLEVPVRSLRKRFKNGDHVKITSGRYKDDTGMVVRVVDDEVTIISDMSMKEVNPARKRLIADHSVFKRSQRSVARTKLQHLFKIRAPRPCSTRVQAIYMTY